ncbi:MAG: preprotein translocase subunit SecY [Clostridia bacterium]|nr:preprotein translocase subunit SecY [Clostridia bacterium]
MKGMFDSLINAIRMPELRKKMLFTLFILAVYTIGKCIPVPGLDREVFTSLYQQWGQFGGLLDMVSGGGLAQATIFALGVTPYINASIIIQLLTVVIPALETLAKEGQSGRKKMNKITRCTAMGLAILQSILLCRAVKSAMIPSLPSWINAILIVVSFTVGTCLVVWLGERINEKGIGNGVSLIIFAGIVSRTPDMLKEMFAKAQDVDGSIANPILGKICGIGLFILCLAVAIGIIVFVLWVQNAERRIQVQYSKKTVGRKLYGGQSSYIPIKVNQSGVMPVIFAMSLLSLPSMILNTFFADSTGKFATWMRGFQPNATGDTAISSVVVYYIVYFLLIIGFTFFYSVIQFNPIEISNNIQKNGGFINGIRPGKPTTNFIQRTAMRLNWADATFLCLVCLVPTLVMMFTGLNGVWFVGTSVLILTGVANDLLVQLESQLVTRNYKGFLD